MSECETLTGIPGGHWSKLSINWQSSSPTPFLNPNQKVQSSKSVTKISVIVQVEAPNIPESHEGVIPNPHWDPSHDKLSSHLIHHWDPYIFLSFDLSHLTLRGPPLPAGVVVVAVQAGVNLPRRLLQRNVVSRAVCPARHVVLKCIQLRYSFLSKTLK